MRENGYFKQDETMNLYWIYSSNDAVLFHSPLITSESGNNMHFMPLGSIEHSLIDELKTIL